MFCSFQRMKKDFQKISKPINNETITPFIEELGIDRIFIDNYLEWEDE